MSELVAEDAHLAPDRRFQPRRARGDVVRVLELRRSPLPLLAARRASSGAGLRRTGGARIVRRRACRRASHPRAAFLHRPRASDGASKHHIPETPCRASSGLSGDVTARRSLEIELNNRSGIEHVHEGEEDDDLVDGHAIVGQREEHRLFGRVAAVGGGEGHRDRGPAPASRPPGRSSSARPRTEGRRSRRSPTCRSDHGRAPARRRCRPGDRHSAARRATTSTSEMQGSRRGGISDGSISARLGMRRGRRISARQYS